MSSHIYPVGFTDHHLVTFDFHVAQPTKRSSHWHFNVKLLQDTVFCHRFEVFWGVWRGKKGEFSCLSQWWEVGKAHIRLLCQQYTSHSTTRIKLAIEQLEGQIRQLEGNIHSHNSTDNRTLKQKQQELSTFLHYRVLNGLW